MSTTTITSMARERFLALATRLQNNDFAFLAENREPMTKTEQVELRQVTFINFLWTYDRKLLGRMLTETWADVRWLNIDNKRTKVLVNGMPLVSADTAFLRAFMDGDIVALRQLVGIDMAKPEPEPLEADYAMQEQKIIDDLVDGERPAGLQDDELETEMAASAAELPYADKDLSPAQIRDLFEQTGEGSK